MKKLRIKFLMLVLLLSIKSIAYCVVAYPYPFQFKQPDGLMITIQLKGDEMVHWAETIDGYTLLNNGKNGWEYAVRNANGSISSSGVLAHEVGTRSISEKKLIAKTSKKLRFSTQQVAMLKSAWNIHAKGGNTPSKAFTPYGTRKLVMILIGFPDKPFSYSKTDFENLMNQTGYNLNGAQGSVKDFFLETSYNHFNVTTTVAGPYMADSALAYYGAPNGSAHDIRARDLMTEAIAKADPDLNYADFDNDGDGSVDGVYIVYAGYGEATSGDVNTIWPHASSIPTQILDGVSVARYSCSNELLGSSGTSITTIGVICHEFGHVCGAPDYYDTDYETNGQYDGAGKWDVMSTGVYNGTPSGCKPAHMVPIDKIRFNWVTPILLSADASVSVSDITTNPVIYRYNTTTDNEYFLIENRQKTGFNSYVSGHGMIIYHVDGNFISTAGNAINVSSHQGMYPVAANSTTSNGVAVSPSNIGSSGCPWPGTTNKTTFDDATTPNSKSWAGNNTNASLTNIAEVGGVVSFCYKSCPDINPAYNFTAVADNGSQINLSWLKNEVNNDVIIAFNTSNTFGDPLNGTTYNVNDILSGGGTIIYKGPASAYNHTGLSPTTDYFYRIWSVNSTPNYSAGTTTSAQTLCASLAVLPYDEGFEGGAIPSCWTQVTEKGSNLWSIQTSGINSHPATPHSGAKLIRCNTLVGGAEYITKLITAPIDLSGSTNPVLKFWHTQQSWDGSQDMLKVYYRTSATDSWKLLTQYTSSISDWTLETIALPDASANYFIAFEATAKTGYGVCIDNIDIRSEDCVSGLWLGTVSSNWFDPQNWCGNIPGIASNVTIPSGTPFSPIINATGAVCRNITIDNGTTVAMDATTAYTLSVSGDWINNGTFTAGIGTVKFNGTNNLQTISGTSTTTFNILEVAKGSVDRILEATSLIALSATTNPLKLTSGTFKLSSNSTLTPFTTSPTIQSSQGIWNNGGTIISSARTWYLAGQFTNSSGTTSINNLYFYTATGSINIIGGNVNISNYIAPYLTGTTVYTQSGGMVNISSAAAAPPFDLTSGCTFNMSGGSIVIQKASAAGALYDYRNLASTYNVTGGTLQIGNASTTGSPTIRINTTVPIYNLVVNATGTPKAQFVANSPSVKNDLNIAAGTTLLGNNLNFSVGGNWNNSGVFTPGIGIVTFNGSVNQTVASGSNNFYGIEINNANGLTASENLNISNSLTLTAGDVNMGIYTLTLGTSASAVGTLNYSAGSVIGKMKRWFGNSTNSGNTGLFPLKFGANYRPVLVEYTTAPTAGGSLTAEFKTAPLTLTLPATTTIPAHGACTGDFNISSLSSDGYWRVDPLDGLTGGTYNITLTGTGFESINNLCELAALKGTNGANWATVGTPAEPSGRTGAPVVQCIGATGWSTWGIGRGSSNLPVELIGFSAKCKSDRVEIQWQTASESNNDYFELQCSFDAVNWTVIKKVKGAGNSNSLLTYTVEDLLLKNTNVYYRLKQVDFDGAYSVSQIISKNCNPDFNGQDINIYPNPVNSTLKITFENNVKTYQAVKISTILGNNIYESPIQLLDSEDELSIDVSGFAKGTYFVQLIGTDRQISKKIVVN